MNVLQHHLAGRTLAVRKQGDLRLRRGEVVLTFDDGPSPTFTPRILATLKDYGVKATFFMVGSMAEAHPETAREVAEAGHTIGTHTHDHTNLSGETLAAALHQVESGEVSVGRVLDPVHITQAPFFRFPYLADTGELRSDLAMGGRIIFDVDVDSRDYTDVTPDAVLEGTLARLDERGSGIILFHDIHARTAAMLPRLLEALEQRGYKVVQVVAPPANPFGIPALVAEKH